MHVLTHLRRISSGVSSYPASASIHVPELNYELSYISNDVAVAGVIAENDGASQVGDYEHYDYDWKLMTGWPLDDLAVSYRNRWGRSNMEPGLDFI